MSISWLDSSSYDFPPLSSALKQPNGLLAVGGDLSPQRLLVAYQNGIFPWYNPGDPILWWSPNPRAVIYPQEFHLSKSLRKVLRKKTYHVTFDTCFEKVMRACAAPRSYADGTWINDAMIKSYCELHQLGHAHSVEVWQRDELVGGLYGIALGQIFFGESMFSIADNASKVGMAYLIKHLRNCGFKLVDCQVASEHLFSLGAIEIPREEFQKLLLKFTNAPNECAASWSTLSELHWE